MDYNIILNSEDVEELGNLLDEMPFKKVLRLAQKIQAQINQQLAGELSAPTEPGAQDGGIAGNHSG